MEYIQAMQNYIRSVNAEMCRDVESCVRVCAHVRVERSVRVCSSCAPACPVCGMVSEVSSVTVYKCMKLPMYFVLQ